MEPTLRPIEEREYARKDATSCTYRDRRRRKSGTNQKAALRTETGRYQSHGAPTRSQSWDAVDVGDTKQSQIGEPTPKTTTFLKAARGRTGHIPIQTTPASRLARRFTKPKYAGPNYSRVYVFRAGHKRRICVLYADPERSVDLLKDKSRVKKETEDLFNTWLKVRDPPRQKRLSESKSNHRLPARRGRAIITKGSRPQSSPVQSICLSENPKDHSTSVNEHNLDPMYSFLEESITRPPSSSQSSSAVSNNRGICNSMIMTNRRPSSIPSNFLYEHPAGLPRTLVEKLHTSAIFHSPLKSQRTLPSEADLASQLPSVYDVGIRKHLALWQELQSKDITEGPQADFQSPEEFDTTENTITQSGEEDSASTSGSLDPASARDWGLISNSEKDDEGDTDVDNFLRPGDVVGFRMKVESILALFIRNFESQSQFYTMQGRWLHRVSRHDLFTIRNVFSQHDVDSIVPYLPDKQVASDALDQFKTFDISVPREVGANVIEKLQAIQSESADIYRRHSERLDRAHSLVAHEFGAKEMTLQEIALVVLQKQHVDDLTNVMLWAVNKALVKNTNFRPLNNIYQRTTPRWRVNPLKLIRRFEQVRVWIRDYVEGVIEQATSSQHDPFPHPLEGKSQNSNPVPGFVRKARNLVQNSRAHRSVTALCGIGPSSQRNVVNNFQQNSVVQISPLTTFDPMERGIIESLKTWCISRDIPSTGTAWSLTPMLLRATKLYDGQQLDQPTGFLFLQEMGVIAPWENRFLYDSGFRLPSAETNPSVVDSIRTVGPAADKSIHHMEDALEGLRKDWGDIPVYCIDDTEAKEIDDGISLERIAGHDSSFWIHVHVANPSAFISPDSAVSRSAANLLQSIYLPEKAYRMLDSKLTQEHFSLARNRPVLTFSAKISLDGEIQETNITPGWVRNTKKVTPKRLGYELGLGQESYEGVYRVLKVGQHVESSPQATAEDDLSPSDIAELVTLQKLGSARRSKRGGYEGTHSFHGSVPAPYVYIASGGIDRTYNSRSGRQFIGDPFISWEAREVDMTGKLSQDDNRAFVADMMILAGEVAARWCSQRNIPIPYRGTIPNPAPPMSPQTYKSEVIDRSMSEKGYVPIMLYRTYNRLLGQSTTRPHPFPHAILSTESYAKATSPLRRYGDMLVHWQIQAALLYEAKHGKGSLLNPSPSHKEDNQDYLPFTRTTLTTLVPQMENRERSIRDMVKHSTNHWIMQLLHRAFHFGEESLPERLEVLVFAEPKTLLVNGNAMGYVKQLSGIDADVLENDASKREGGVKLGDWWEGRIQGVDVYQARLMVAPVRLLRREEVWKT
ncbi:MAG: hypothetical protein Q9188_003133 [Gyalolechia gomerana]